MEYRNQVTMNSRSSRRRPRYSSPPLSPDSFPKNDHAKALPLAGLCVISMLFLVPSMLLYERRSVRGTVAYDHHQRYIAQRQQERAAERLEYLEGRRRQNNVPNPLDYENNENFFNGGGDAAETDENEKVVEDIYSKYDYRQPVVPNNQTLPSPRIFNDTTIVICLSARKNWELRQAIRDTWGKGHAVYFIVGGARSDDAPELQAKVRQEQTAHRDLLDTGHPDSYYSLVHKLKTAYHWTVQSLPTARWFVKIDDDSVARVSTLEKTLLRIYNPSVPLVMGEIVVDSPVHKDGKWAEPLYPHDTYPYWAKGSTGHVVSRPVAAYIASLKNPVYYQGEDTSLGIWLDEAANLRTNPLHTTWIRSPYFQNHGRCTEHEWLIIGHYLTAQQMRDCFQVIDEWEHSKIAHKHHSLYYTSTHAQKEAADYQARLDGRGGWG